MRRWIGVAALVASCGTGQSRRAESVPVEQLPVAADTIVVPWVDHPEAAWLGGRRWVVVSTDQDALAYLDFTSGQLAPVGRGDTASLAKPYGVFAVDDTAFVLDWGKRQVSVWSGDGTIVGRIPAPAGTRGVLPRARDAAGQYYFEISPIAGRDGSGLRDSAAVVRSNPAMTTFDTVARLAPPDVAEITERQGKRLERLVFSGSDWWGVRPNGTLWVARVRRNEVWRLVGDDWKRGERLPDPVLEVTLADRERHISSFPEDLRNMAKQSLQFAPLKPPFERAHQGPDGSVWLRKSKAIVDSIRRYHVVDTTGALARIFTTLGPGQIIAVGAEAVLVAEQFKEGVRLMEVRIPAPPPPPATQP